MNTQIVFSAFKGLKFSERLGFKPIHGYTGINWRRLAVFAPFLPAPPMSAGNPVLPGSLEEWLTSSRTIEIGSPMATTESRSVIHA